MSLTAGNGNDDLILAQPFLLCSNLIAWALPYLDEV